jgi:nitrogen regulatory protein PII
MMKMVMIVYNEAMDSEVFEVLTHCALKNYTKIESVSGKGDSSGTHLGNDVWPGKNNLLYVACEDADAQRLLTCVETLRKNFSQEGIKAFMWPLEKITP